jgi:hypothetical protein
MAVFELKPAQDISIASQAGFPALGGEQRSTGAVTMASVQIRDLGEQWSFGCARLGRGLGQHRRRGACARSCGSCSSDRGVIVFEGMEPSSQMQVALSTVFGPLKDHPTRNVPRAGDRHRRRGDRHAATARAVTSQGHEHGLTEVDGTQRGVVPALALRPQLQRRAQLRRRAARGGGRRRSSEAAPASPTGSRSARQARSRS